MEADTKTEVYVVMLFSNEDTFWYVLDKENWDNLDHSDLCMEITQVKHLCRPSSLQELFSLTRENGWVVVDSAEDLFY